MNKYYLKRNELLSQKLINSLKKRNFEAYFCTDKESANKLILNLILKDEVISWGGSVTIDQLGIKEILKGNNYKLLDRDSAKTSEERENLIAKSLTSDVFLMSANAISEDGEIVNIDKKGNRIAALCYGPKRVFIVIGTNKIVKSLDDAISRARNIAAPINAQRISNIMEMNTPCTLNGSCGNCKSEDSICSHILITRLCYPKNRINVIIINEELGF